MRLRLGSVAAALALGLAIVALAPRFVAPASAEGVIGMDAVRAGLQRGDIVLVDVREADEFGAGHVPGAVNLPLSGFSAAKLPRPADKTVVVMCRSGNRSTRAQALAAAAGRGDVVNYTGSMNEWSAKGGAIVTGR